MLKKHNPRPFPTILPMEKEARDKHAKYGRIFDISLLCFEIKSCTCCGITVPVHSNSVVTRLTRPPFKVTYLSTKFFPSFKCTCTDVCFGEQYYSINSTKQKEFYVSIHPGNTNTFPSEPYAEL